MSFTYGARYLNRPDAISLSPTLPLKDAVHEPTGYMALPSAIRDAAPDAWGRRVILNRLTGSRGDSAETADLPERTYLIESDSDRIGGLDFQRSPAAYVPRGGGAPLPDLQRVAEMVSLGEQLPAHLHGAVLSGTGIGGARPKALVSFDGVPSMVKFSVSTDVFPAVEAEALASRLAGYAGLNTATVQAITIGGRYGLVSERFDRENGARRLVVSALTITGRDEMGSRFGSYPELAEKISKYALDAEQVGPEIFKRIAFNMAISNNDDHLRNHAAFWNGAGLELTPAYDLAPAARREGAEVTQTLAYGLDGEKIANLADLIKQSHLYGLNKLEAAESVEAIRDAIESNFKDAADEMRIPAATLSTVRGSFLHDTVTRGLLRNTARPSPPSGRPKSGTSLGQSRRGDQGLGKTAGGGNAGSFAAHRRTEADGSALGLPPIRD